MKALLALALAASTAVPAFGGGSPDDWDAPWSSEQLEREARELRHEVEALRGKPFRAEVSVRSLSEARLRARRCERLDHDARSAPADLLGTVAVLLGMLPPDADPSALARAMCEAPVAYYDGNAEVLFLREGLGGTCARLALVRELAHALDEQYAFEPGPAVPVAAATTDARLARRGVVLGSELALAEAWLRDHSIGPGVLEVLGLGVGLERACELPPFVWKPVVLLLARGEAFLRRTSVVRPVAGTARPEDVERALAAPPRSTEQLLHPVKYWKPARVDEPRPVRCDASRLPAGWSLVGADTLGELYLGIFTLPLGERGGLEAATPRELANVDGSTRAAAGWGGDHVVLLRHGDGHALHLVTVWDTPRDASEFTDAVVALRPWISGGLVAGAGLRTAGFEVGRGRGGEVWITSWSGVERRAVDDAVGTLECCGVHEPDPR